MIAVLEAACAVIVWGASFIATKLALQSVAPLTIVWLRFTMGVVILGITVWARRQFKLPKGSDWFYFALLGTLGITFHQWLQSNGLVTSQASTTAWIVASTPVIIAVLGWLFLREKLNWMKAAGIILAIFGVVLVVSKGNLLLLTQGKFSNPGDVLILISAPNWAVFSVISRYSLKTHPAARMMFYVMLLGWIGVSVLFFTGPGFSDIANLSIQGWFAVSFLGIFCSGLAYIFWYDALQALPASQVGAFLYLEPLVAVAVAAVILREAVSFSGLFGGLIILFGVWLVNLHISKKG